MTVSDLNYFYFALHCKMNNKIIIKLIKHKFVTNSLVGDLRIRNMKALNLRGQSLKVPLDQITSHYR